MAILEKVKILEQTAGRLTEPKLHILNRSSLLKQQRQHAI
jgi:hypothetical protein